MKLPIKRYWSLLRTYLRPQWRRMLTLGIPLILKNRPAPVNPQIIRAFGSGACRRADHAATAPRSPLSGHRCRDAGADRDQRLCRRQGLDGDQYLRGWICCGHCLGLT